MNWIDQTIAALFHGHLFYDLIEYLAMFWPVVVLLIFAVVGAIRLWRPWLRRRSTMWFSGLVASAFMLLAGVVYGLSRQ